MDEPQESVAEPTPDTPPARKKKRYHIRTWLFCVMLLLALVGLAVTMSMDRGGWEYWVFLLAFYGCVSVYWGWQRARKKGEPVWRMVRAQVFHWCSVLVAFSILSIFERTEVINRVAASDVSLLILALACFLAGVHFEWTFLLIGVVLTIMAVSVGYLEIYLIWIVMVPCILVAGWVFFQIRNRRGSEAD